LGEAFLEQKHGFNPELGARLPRCCSITPNAWMLVNGEQSTVDDRGGEPLPTWRGITADIESVLASLDTPTQRFRMSHPG
jgi:hypothetical protein